MSKIYEHAVETHEAMLIFAEKERDYEMYPFRDEKEYIHALIRYTHPLHNRAMTIRNNRQKAKQSVGDIENLPSNLDYKHSDLF